MPRPAVVTVTDPAGQVWTIRRHPRVRGWLATHQPTGIGFHATSVAVARGYIRRDTWGREIATRLRPQPQGRRDWYTDEHGVTHLYTGPLCSWRCDEHHRVCDPFRPITATDADSASG